MNAIPKLLASLLFASTLHLPAASFRNLSFEEGVFPFPVTPETVNLAPVPEAFAQKRAEELEPEELLDLYRGLSAAK